MAKITYLLGAGASIGSLPIVDDFEKEIQIIIYNLKRFIGNIPDQLAVTFDGDRGLVFYAVRDLQILLDGCKLHRSVDTFAKMLFLTASKNEERLQKYRKLKCSIILFFELYRYYNNKTDKRYDALLATIMNASDPFLPKDINILSWNYDYEFERAYMNYSPEKKDIHEVYDDLNIIHKNSVGSKSIGNNFGIIKINGTAGFFTNNNKLILGLNNHTLTKKENIDADLINIKPILENYKTYSENNRQGGFAPEYQPAISFSWEEDKGNTISKEIANALKNTELFIVIGYSFPYFNRLVDQKIASSIQLGGARVIIQNPQADEFVDTMNEIRYWQPNSIKVIKNCDQFYVRF